MTRFHASMWLLSLVCACAGKAETTEQQQGNHTISAQDQKECDALTDSGVDALRCEALSCCTEIVACNANPEGVAFNNCTLNCSFNATGSDDLMACNQACMAAHPTGYTACSPAAECILRACTTK